MNTLLTSQVKLVGGECWHQRKTVLAIRPFKNSRFFILLQYWIIRHWPHQVSISNFILVQHCITHYPSTDLSQDSHGHIWMDEICSHHAAFAPSGLAFKSSIVKYFAIIFCNYRLQSLYCKIYCNYILQLLYCKYIAILHHHISLTDWEMHPSGRIALIWCLALAPSSGFQKRPIALNLKSSVLQYHHLTLLENCIVVFDFGARLHHHSFYVWPHHQPPPGAVTFSNRVKVIDRRNQWATCLLGISPRSCSSHHQIVIWILILSKCREQLVADISPRSDHPWAIFFPATGCL